jgi:hypothetical protein
MALEKLSLDPRRSPREPVTLPCRVTSAELLEVHATLLNISPFGAMARCAEPMTLDQRVTINLPIIGRVPSRIIWATSSAFGVEFSSQLPLAGYLALLKAAKPTG